LTDIAEFEDPADADVVENLETLCAECHGEHHPFSEK
jgi:predicted HNH restriction endonuclease